MLQNAAVTPKNKKALAGKWAHAVLTVGSSQSECSQISISNTRDG